MRSGDLCHRHDGCRFARHVHRQNEEQDPREADRQEHRNDKAPGKEIGPGAKRAAQPPKHGQAAALRLRQSIAGLVGEDSVQIGSHCSIYSVSTIDKREGRITLKKNCKIGSHSVVMPGVTVGENAIIGAFSFVNKDIPKNTMAFGVPAKVKKKIR